MRLNGFAIPLCSFQTTNIFVAGPVGGDRVLLNVPRRGAKNARLNTYFSFANRHY